MADIVSKRKRSEMMAAVKPRGNLTTERAIKSLFRQHSIKGWRCHQAIQLIAPNGDRSIRSRRAWVRPDFAFRKERVAVFVDGCFWHRCPTHYRTPKTNAVFWDTKIQENRRRDLRTRRALRKIGWRVVRIWEHEIRSSTARCAGAVAAALADFGAA